MTPSTSSSSSSCSVENGIFFRSKIPSFPKVNGTRDELGPPLLSSNESLLVRFARDAVFTERRSTANILHRCWPFLSPPRNENFLRILTAPNSPSDQDVGFRFFSRFFFEFLPKRVPNGNNVDSVSKRNKNSKSSVSFEAAP